MTRTPLALAALASAAVPGLDPVSVQEVHGADERFDVAFVLDAEDRRWVVRCPRTEAAAAQMEQAAVYTALLGRRMPFAIPIVRGWAALETGGRASVTHYLPGQHLDFATLPEGPGITADLGRTIALLHNADPALAEEAGLSFYTAEEYRRRRLTELDRSAATGRVPTALLARWEAALEDESLWGFRPLPVHGRLSGDHVIVQFTDEEDATSGTVRALTGWEDAKVADPADDFVEIAAEADQDALNTVLEAYAHTRVERPDGNLLVRARLLGEMAPLRSLLAAMALQDAQRIEEVCFTLRHLDTELADAEPFTAVVPVPRVRTRTIVLPEEEPQTAADQGDDDQPAEDEGNEDRPVETEFDEEHLPPAVPVVGGHVVTGEHGGPPAHSSGPTALPRVHFDDEDGDDDVTAPHPPAAPS